MKASFWGYLNDIVVLLNAITVLYLTVYDHINRNREAKYSKITVRKLLYKLDLIPMTIAKYYISEGEYERFFELYKMEILTTLHTVQKEYIAMYYNGCHPRGERFIIEDDFVDLCNRCYDIQKQFEKKSEQRCVAAILSIDFETQYEDIGHQEQVLYVETESYINKLRRLLESC